MIFQRPWISIAKNPYIFVIFQGAGGGGGGGGGGGVETPCPPPLDPHMLPLTTFDNILFG